MCHELNVKISVCLPYQSNWTMVQAFRKFCLLFLLSFVRYLSGYVYVSCLFPLFPFYCLSGVTCILKTRKFSCHCISPFSKRHVTRKKRVANIFFIEYFIRFDGRSRILDCEYRLIAQCKHSPVYSTCINFPVV